VSGNGNTIWPTISWRDGVKQASHWHNKLFTPWHEMAANEGRTRDSMRRDAWRCGSGEVVRAMWRKF